MVGAVETSLLDSISIVLAERCGLRLDDEKRADIENCVLASAVELGFNDPNECAEWLASSNPTAAQIRILASYLTVGETYFFRERASFRAIEEKILPELIAKRRTGRRRLRIWSAGCCTGEEPYSIAVSLDKCLPDIEEWDVKVVATDINPRFLKKAAGAEYGEWSFRNHSDALLESYFTRTKDNLYRINPRLRRRVEFAPLNLAEDPYPSPTNGTAELDVIVCRNVLMYLNDACAARVVRNFGQCLVRGGWLIVSPAEGMLVQGPVLAPANLPGVSAFRKSEAELIQRKIPVSQARSSLETERSRQAPVLRKITPYDRRLRLNSGDATVSNEGDVNITIHESLARKYANQGDLDRALDCCTASISNEKLNPRLHYLRAMILQEKGDLLEAAVYFRRAIYLDPDFVMAHVGAGHLALELGNSQEAEQHLHRARRLLRRLEPQQTVPEADGLSARHLAELIAKKEGE